MSNDTETIKTIIERISTTLTNKGGEYKDSVISILPRADWLSQIVIKANRAQRALSDEKLKDELLDTACYCILLLDKIERDAPKVVNQTKIADHIYTDNDNTHHTGKRPVKP